MKKITSIFALVTLVVFIIIALNFDTPSFEAFDIKIRSLLFENSFIILFHNLGETKFIIVATVIMLLYLAFFKRDLRSVLFVLLTVGVGNGLNQLLKRIFARPRPELEDQLSSFSFPSGHAQISVMFFLTLAYLIAKWLKNKKWKFTTYTVMLILIFLIGLSRIAEGRHYATDVLAGWSIGYTWFIICVLWYESKKHK
ncbi:phosphatase PAP2 family protein [Solibacillus sp. FSL W7-1324]|uniref:phosphatase PAP2 family protein n=1 Tax=Solibacillus sp. FSL W7-1324 TaxID=2921701 RepID=UPI0030F7A0C5